ncbi:MAG: PSD1 and planctomycete cytochrome C domain-containing protein, partial [Actinomycetota bacterium]
MALALAVLGFAGAGAVAAAKPPPKPEASPEQIAFFEAKVRPVLLARCASCHGPKFQQAGLRLDTAAGLKKGADTGPVVSGEDPAKSSLLRAIRWNDRVKMPPAGKLQPAEIAALEEWVKQGAPWPEPLGAGKPSTGTARPHWAFQPVRRPAPPAVKARAWVKTPVDAFILAPLERRGLAPAPAADRRTLIRRATYDLTGLPPTPEEVEAFVNDRAPDAWVKVVDRLLASRHYGERWGRRWLDVVHYADTAGETADYPVREAYRYRNYVIDSFNRDKPYDEFLREQIAGDILAATGPPERYAERVTATGFLAISRRFGFDPQNYHHLTIDDTIDTLGKSMLGVSLGCARCHDHKFDPVPTSDYYGLYGIFAGTKYAFPGSEEVKRPRDFVPLVPPSEAASLQAKFDQRMAALNAEAKAAEGERAQVRASVGLDGDLELQDEGAVPGAPWTNGPNSPSRVRSTAQSPYDHVFPIGSRGLAFENTGDYRGFGQQLPKPWTPAATERIHYAVDFRNTTVAAGGGGSHRFYVGHGPGVSAAVELFVNGETLYARSGGAIEPVRPVKVGEWHHVALTLDLRARTYSGSVGTPGDLTPLTGKAFATGWDGVIDYHFVDSYGHLGGVRPGLDVDNLTVREAPIPPIHRASPDAKAMVRAPAQRSRLRQLEARLAAIETERATLAERGPYEVAYGVTEGVPQDAPILRRGDPLNKGEVVSRRVPVAFGGGSLPPVAQGSGRLQLAEWITDPANPLTARVIVNRVWQHHFGFGLVRTPNDFGTRGAPPTHPELLDWLAAAFTAGVGGQGSGAGGETLETEVRRSGAGKSGKGTGNDSAALPNPRPPAPGPRGLGWSLKKLHRLIMLSSVYRTASEPTAAAVKVDAENHLLSHQNRRRLEAEEIRDAMLSVSGDLDPTMGGAHPFPPVSTWGFTQHGPFTATYPTRRRSVYVMTQRIRKHPFFALFDGAEPNASTAERTVTTTPLQALFMLNDPFAHEQAGKLAERLMSGKANETARITWAYQLCYGRAATDVELREAAAFLSRAR